MKKFVVILVMLVLVGVGMCVLLLDFADFMSSGLWTRTFWDVFQYGPVTGGWGPDSIWMRIVFADHEGTGERLWNAEWGNSQIILWKVPPGFQVGLPPWLLGVLSLFFALLMFRGVRRRSARKDTLCRHCDYDLTGNQDGACPECGLPIDLVKPVGSSRMVLNIIPWNILAPLVLIPLILAVAGFTVIPYYRGIHSMDVDLLDNGVETSDESQQIDLFKRLLAKVALQWGMPDQSDETLLEMMDEHLAVRRWVRDHYDRLPGPQQHVLMGIIRNQAPTQTWPEMGPVLKTAIQKDRLAIWACQALAYYDIPERKELLLTMVQYDPVQNPFHVRSGIRQFIPMFGWQEMEEPILQLLKHKEWEVRTVIAAIVFAQGEGPLRSEANKVLLDSMGDLEERRGDEIEAVFYELNRFDACVESPAFEEAIREIIIDSDKKSPGHALDSYRSRCH